jgi:Fe2+ transport system protein FeoA
MEVLTLDQAAPGQKIILKSLENTHTLYFKLISLGILAGDQLQVMGKAPFGGPISLKHGSETFFALRKSEAKEIIVEKV